MGLKKWDTGDHWFRLVATLIGISVVDAWKLSVHHTLFSKLKMRHRAELNITVNVFAGILTTKLLTKARNVMKSLVTNSIDTVNIGQQPHEEILELSFHRYTHEKKKQSVCHYPTVQHNKTGKRHMI